MRKSIVRLMMIALASMMVAQSSFADGHMRVAGVAGISLATIDAETQAGAEKATDSNFGWAAGVSLEWMLMDYIYIQPELLWIRKGSEFVGRDGFNQAILIQSDVDYASLPILLKGKYDMDMFAVYALAGPSFNFKIDEAASGTTANVQPTDIVAEYKAFDFGVVFGAGIEFEAMDGMDVYLDARYDYGLTDINDAKVSTVEIQNRAWEFLVGVGWMI